MLRCGHSLEAKPALGEDWTLLDLDSVVPNLLRVA